MREPIELVVIGDCVTKVRGYKFPGTVQAVFYTREGEKRIVVEHQEITGLLHIFNPEQFVYNTGEPEDE